MTNRTDYAYQQHLQKHSVVPVLEALPPDFMDKVLQKIMAKYVAGMFPEPFKQQLIDHIDSPAFESVHNLPDTFDTHMSERPDNA